MCEASLETEAIVPLNHFIASNTIYLMKLAGISFPGHKLGHHI